MDCQIPPLLLNIPAPEIDATQFDDKGRLLLTLEVAAHRRVDYFERVALNLRKNAPSMEHELTPAVEFALRLFNAENFTGELSPAERAHFSEVYNRFGAPKPVDPKAAKKARAVDEELLTETGNPVLASAKDAYMQRLLASDGEMVSSCVRLGGLLLCVLAIVSARDAEGPDAGSFLFSYTNPWRLRAHIRHQLCLLHRAHSVFLEVSACIDAVMTQPDEDVSVDALLEVGHAQNHYHHRELAAETFRRAILRSRLDVHEDAIVGVRTRYQQNQQVQMIVSATSARPVPEASTREEQPKTIMMEKDGHDLLDRPRETADGERIEVTPLHPEDKALILAMGMDIRNNNPYHGLTQHHMQTYVERLLADPARSPFAIRCQTLLIRSRLEARRNRVQERSFLQMTELVDQYGSAQDPNHARFGRTESAYLYCVAYPPIWSLKSEYADVCFEETLYKTALDVYEQVLDWEKINECCKKLDRRRRAEFLARDMIETDPNNPLLWVALGEATHDDAHLWKAWELCRHKMGAPMRALARLALSREHYDKVVEYFDKAVKINPVFGGDWFTLGYASLKLENWSRGGEAFTRVCQINPGDSFAWNNLASIMLRDGKLRPAFNAMSQALRNNRRDWRMWQNYFQIGCQLKEVTETTNALNIALTLAKRNIKLDRKTLDQFVDNNVAYIKGQIPGRSADAEENPDVQSAGAVSYRSMAAAPATGNEEQQQGVAAEAIEHLPVTRGLADDVPPDTDGYNGNEEEESAEASELGDLVPLGADEDLSREQIYAASNAVTGLTSAASAAEQPDAELQAAIRQRHGERVRTLFKDLMEMFVSDPDLYSCAARFIGFLDGPLAAYAYRVKELRACRQRDQWERTESLFARTVECLGGMTADAAAALHVAHVATEQPPGASAGTAEDSTGAGSPSAVPAAAPTPDQVIEALKDTQNNIKAVLEATKEHMEKDSQYATLRTLSKNVRTTLQEAKAAFV